MKNFRVNVTIQRPGIFQHGGSNPLRAREPSASSSVRAVPASFQYVEVYQNELFGSFCGAAFTDAEGTLDGVAFSGGNNYPNEIRLVVSEAVANVWPARFAGHGWVSRRSRRRLWAAHTKPSVTVGSRS